MKPSELETKCQQEASQLIERMIELSKAKDPVIAFRATEFLIKRGYGDIGRTQRDPWDSEKKQKGVAAMLNSIFNGDGSDPSDAEPGTPADTPSAVPPSTSDKIEGKTTTQPTEESDNVG